MASGRLRLDVILEAILDVSYDFVRGALFSRRRP